jgi:hypothetical protein
MGLVQSVGESVPLARPHAVPYVLMTVKHAQSTFPVKQALFCSSFSISSLATLKRVLSMSQILLQTSSTRTVQLLIQKMSRSELRETLTISFKILTKL